MSGTQWLVVSQKAEGTQSLSEAQETPQAPLLHTYGAHAVTWPDLHVPAPSQAKPVCCPPVHVVAPQAVPLGYRRHAPAPEQKPSCLQESEPSFVQSLSGSVPAPTLSQTPSCPELFLSALHAWHVPVHGESQHTPSTQLPVTHCVLEVHARPLAWSGSQVAVVALQ
jgi:hypothetical protein